MISWDKKYLSMAHLVSTWSKDPSTKVGAVIVDDSHRPISFGYNGLPQGVDDNYNILYHRELKYKTIIHAEINAILFAKTDLKGATLYTWPFQPCARCTSVIIQSGIKRIVTVSSSSERWKEDFELSRKFIEEAGIIFKEYNVEDLSNS